ncbi:MAG: PIN domain-containing protein [Candidatus Micrarchaeota archaeon]
MLLVVDTNVIISAALKRSITQEVLFNRAFVCYAPEYVRDEIEKHKNEIMKKSQYKDEEFHTILSIIFSKLTIVPEEDYMKYKEEVLKFTPDPDDWPFLALAMYLGAGLWTYDAALKEKQNIVKIVTTTDLLNLLRK